MAIERSSRVAILQAGLQAGSLALSSTVDMPGGCLPSSVAFDAQGRLWAAGKSTGLIPGAHTDSRSWACDAKSDGASLQFTARACSAEPDGAVLGPSLLGSGSAVWPVMHRGASGLQAGRRAYLCLHAAAGVSALLLNMSQDCQAWAR